MNQFVADHRPTLQNIAMLLSGALSLEHSVWFESFASDGTRIAVQDVSELSNVSAHRTDLEV